MDDEIFRNDFENMNELHTSGNVRNSFDFLRLMPSLEKVKVDLINFDATMNLKMAFPNLVLNGIKVLWIEDMAQNSIHSEMNHVVMTNLTFLHIDFRFGASSLRTMSRWMPNINKH